MKAIIIDDEPDCVKLLSLQIKMYCPQVQVIAACTSSTEGLLKIKELHPDIVFMDIEMPVMNGFQLLEQLDPINFSLVFVTAYDQFAVKAFRFNALDYLLKPIDGKDLKKAVEKAMLQKPDPQQLRLLKQQLTAGEKYQPDKIALPYQNGVTFTEIKNVLYCEADNNYTRFFYCRRSAMLGFKNTGRHTGSAGRKKFFKGTPAIPYKSRPYKKICTRGRQLSYYE